MMTNTSSSDLDTAVGLTREALAAYLGIPEAYLIGRGLTTIHAPDPSVRVPCFGPHGSEISARVLVSLTDDRANRCIGKYKRRPNGLDQLADAQHAGRLTIVIGDLPAWILGYHGEPVLALPSEDVWDDDRYSPLLDTIRQIHLVVTDGDRDALVERFRRSRLRPRIQIVDLGADSILNLHRAAPERFPECWETLRQGGRTFDDLDRDNIAQERADAYDLAKDLLHDPQLIDQLKSVIAARGYAGDVRIVLLIYVVLTSRLLPKPSNAVIVSESAAGKTATVEAAIGLVPEHAVILVSAASPAALIYSDEEVRHRTVFFAEADSIPEDGHAASAIRALFTDSRLVYQTVELDPATGKMMMRQIVKEGPTNIITTSTRPLSRQMNTRTMEYRIDTTPEQTRAIMRAQSERYLPSRRALPDLTPFVALQRYLELCDDHDVTIPYAGELSEAIPQVGVRTRRDFNQLLTIIQAITVLHREQRERLPDGRLIATIEDYQIARDLVAPHFDRVERTLSAAMQQTIDAVREGEALSITEIGQRLGLRSSSSVHERVKRAIKAGYLVDHNQVRGKAARIARAKSTSNLPTAEELERVFGFSGRLPGDPLPPPPAGDAEETPTN